MGTESPGEEDNGIRFETPVYDMTREETARMVGRSLPTVRKRIRAFMAHARAHLTTIRTAASVGIAVLLAQLAQAGGLA